MSTSSMIAYLSIDAAKKGLKQALDAVSKVLQKEAYDKYRVWKFRFRETLLTRNMEIVRRVKTILSLEENIDLAEFYYPTRIEWNSSYEKEGYYNVRGNDRRKVVNDLSDFMTNGSILITGTVGQGKSIFVRYLAAHELIKGQFIPVFAELRCWDPQKTLLEFLLGEIESMGLALNASLLKLLCEHGRLMFFLDGLDEVAEKDRAKLLSQIEILIRTHARTQIILSSRPNTGAEGSPYFKVFRLSHLDRCEYEDVLKHFLKEDSHIDKIVRAVSKSSIKQVLTTPLMVALLVVRFRIEESVPSNEIEFFSDLFDLLIRRHDQWKSGFKRSRRSAAGDDQLKSVFCGICFFWKRQKMTGEFRRSDLCQLAREVMILDGMNENPETVVEDIVNITNLIIEDSGFCKFVHKSIQEFHAAVFISRRPEPAAEKIYGSLLNDWRAWSEEIRYLAMVDRYRYLKYFSIPDMILGLRLQPDSIPNEWPSSESDVATLLIAALRRPRACFSGKVELILASYRERSLDEKGVGLDGPTLTYRCWTIAEQKDYKILQARSRGSKPLDDASRSLILESDPSVKRALQNDASYVCRYVHSELLNHQAELRRHEGDLAAFSF